MAKKKTTGDGKGIVNTNIKEELKVSRAKAPKPGGAAPQGYDWNYDSSTDRWYLAPGRGYADTSEEAGFPGGVRRVW